MPLNCIAGDKATCGHSLTGSNKVLINKKGVSRVGIDTAGGLIVGPGSIKVTVEGYPASFPGDAVADHGKDEHNSAKTTAGAQSIVITGS